MYWICLEVLDRSGIAERLQLLQVKFNTVIILQRLLCKYYMHIFAINMLCLSVESLSP